MNETTLPPTARTVAFEARIADLEKQEAEAFARLASAIIDLEKRAGWSWPFAIQKSRRAAPLDSLKVAGRAGV